MNKARITAAVATAAILTLAGCGTTPPPSLPRMEPVVMLETTGPVVAANPGPQMVSGTIRWISSNQWAILDDAGHAPTGVSSVVVMADRVRVNYDFTAAKVSSLQATPDEAFASANVRVGASVGLTHADIFFYMPSYGANPVPPALLSKSGANVWISGWFWVDPA